jgi:hypothetical protein
LKLSNKKIKANKDLTVVYKIMDDEAMRTDLLFCCGCEDGSRPVHHSHILSRGQHKKLIADPANILYDCVSIGGIKGCHDKWEDKYPNELVQLKNLGYRLEYVAKHDSALFWDLIDKINKYLEGEL